MKILFRLENCMFVLYYVEDFYPHNGLITEFYIDSSEAQLTIDDTNFCDTSSQVLFFLLNSYYDVG